MLHLEDKITIAVGGPIKAGKDFFLRYVDKYKETLYSCLQGNFWVPQQVQVISEEHNQELFRRYSAQPERYAFEFQMACLSNRLAQQTKVDTAQGLVFHGQPLEIDRHIYAEANRQHIGDAFSTYEQLYEQVRKRVTSPDVWIYLRIPEKKIGILLDRIRSHGREGEQKFLDDHSYLRENIQKNEYFFKHIVRQPVITIDATDPVFGTDNDEGQLLSLYQTIAAQIQEYKQPPRLTLLEWKAVDYNRAQKGTREARRQLRKYLAAHQTIITMAGLVGVSKTSMAELLQEELDIDIMRELSGGNDAIVDELLAHFLLDKKRYGYELQRSLIPKRIGRRKQQYQSGRSFVEDRSPVEDQSIFWRRLRQQGYLSSSQIKELIGLAKKAYAAAPQSDLMIKLLRTPQACREMILARGRPQEIAAWPEAELEKMKLLYDDLFHDMRKYGSHDGPTLELDLATFDPKNTIHLGHLWQEMLHSFLEWEERKKK